MSDSPPAVPTVTAPSRPPAPSAVRSALEPLQPRLLWTVGIGLAAEPALGPDSAIYAVSREGNLDVVEPSGKLRFTVGLDGLAQGPIHVDERGAAYVATTRGVVVGVSAQGRRLFTYRVPAAVSSGLSFAEGLGLLLRAGHHTLLALNRAGIPTFRHDSNQPIVWGPWGFGGQCVAITSEGELFGLTRFGKRTKYLSGIDVATVTTLAATQSSELWVQAGANVTVLGRSGEVRFEVPQVLAMTTVRGDSPAAAGVILGEDETLRWLDAFGRTLGERKLPPLTQRRELRLSAAQELVWLVEGERLIRIAAEGPFQVGHVESVLGAPLPDPANRRVVLGTADGKLLTFGDVK